MLEGEPNEGGVDDDQITDPTARRSWSSRTGKMTPRSTLRLKAMKSRMAPASSSRFVCEHPGGHEHKRLPRPGQLHQPRRDETEAEEEIGP